MLLVEVLYFKIEPEFLIEIYFKEFFGYYVLGHDGKISQIIFRHIKHVIDAFRNGKELAVSRSL